MIDFWKQCEGQVVNGEYRLLRLLGAKESSAVFLTELDKEKGGKLAIKLLRENSSDTNLQLVRWKLAAEMAHPLLLKIFKFGRCQMSAQATLFVVMEYAEESLSEILPQRALSSAEATEMAGPIVEALQFLHGKGWVHGHVKPANILAVEDRLKLSSDGICHAGDQLFGFKQSLYFAPEAVNGVAAPSNDIWGLGVTLTETLTQSLPVWKSSGHEDPRLEKPLPAPFDVIVPRCLTYDPQKRWQLGEISECLRTETTGSMPQQVRQGSGLSQSASEQSNGPVSRKRYAISLLAGILAAALITYGLLHHGQPETSSAAHSQSEAQSADSAQNNSEPSSVMPAPARTPATPSARDGQPSSSTSSPTSKLAARNASFSSSGATQSAGVVREFLPPVSRRSRNTIHGRVHVSVKVRVDNSGNVSGASFDSPGPSRYFARLALDASKDWKFVPAETPANNASRQWLLRYQFGREDTKVEAKQLR